MLIPIDHRAEKSFVSCAIDNNFAEKTYLLAIFLTIGLAENCQCLISCPETPLPALNLGLLSLCIEPLNPGLD